MVKLKDFAINKIALPIIRHYGSGNAYSEHFKNEHLVCGHKYKWGVGFNREINDILCLLSLQDNNNNSIESKLSLIEKITNFNLIRPLSLTDSEFYEPHCKIYQNKWVKSVFYDDIKKEFTDSDAIKLISCGYRYEMAGKETQQYDDNNILKGIMIVIDDVNNKVYASYSTAVIINQMNFIANNQIILPYIEVYDKNDKEHDYFCHVVRQSDIPTEFFTDYRLIETNELKNKFKSIEDNIESMVSFVSDNKDLLLNILKDSTAKKG